MTNMIASAELTNTEIFAFVVVLDFNKALQSSDQKPYFERS